MVQLMHIDSCILRGFVDSEDRKERRNEAKHLLNSASRTSFRVSILAIGEVFGKMAEVRDPAVNAEAAAEFRRLVKRGRIDIYGIGKDVEAIKLAAEMMNSDYAMAPADAILLACAFTDERCRTFVTSDQRIIRDANIQARATSCKVQIMDISHPARAKGSHQIGKPSYLEIRQPANRSMSEDSL